MSKIIEKFEDGYHSLAFELPAFMTQREEDEAEAKVLEQTHVTPYAFTRGQKDVQFLNGTGAHKVVWRLPLHVYSGNTELKFKDMMVVVSSLAEDEKAVITQLTAIPFDPSTGYYLGKETDSGEPLNAYTCSPDVQEQLNLGRTIDAERLSVLLNVVACDGQPPVWLDDETGNLRDCLADFGIWSLKVSNPLTVRTWVLEYADMSKIRNAGHMAVKQAGFSIGSEKADDDRVLCLHGYRILQEARGQVSEEGQATEHRPHTGNTVEDAVFAINEASFVWNRMSSLGQS